MSEDTTFRRRSLFRKIRTAYYEYIGKRRRYLRAPLKTKVTEKVSGLFEYFITTNISAGGMFLKTDRPFAVGSKLEIEFKLPASDELISAEARVVRTCPPGNHLGLTPGMGIEYNKIDPKDREKIDEFVKKPGVY